MNPLATLLSLPASGPLGLLTWIARQVAKAAAQQLLDPGRIETALLQLERRLEDGVIDEAAFEAEEERLLAELAEITALRAAEAKAGTEEDGEEDEDEAQDGDSDEAQAEAGAEAAGSNPEGEAGSGKPETGANIEADLIPTALAPSSGPAPARLDLPRKTSVPGELVPQEARAQEEQVLAAQAQAAQVREANAWTHL